MDLSTGFLEYGRTFSSVIPAEAGIQDFWTSAFAGVTKDDADELCMCDRTCDKEYYAVMQRNLFRNYPF